MNAEKYREKIEDQLENNVLPFWIEKTVDDVHGGYLHQLDRDGTVLSPNKGMWVHGRLLWLVSWLYRTRRADPKLLETGRRGFAFINAHARDSDGRWWYELSRTGAPIRKRRYLFSEVFMALGLTSWAAVDQTETSRTAATQVLSDLSYWLDHHGDLPAKFEPGIGTLRSHSSTMILINLYQEVRAVCDTPEERRSWSEKIDRQIAEIFTYFVKEADGVLLETVGERGEIIDTPEGREINPGHAIETAWFLLEEARSRDNKALQDKAISILSNAMDWGWDEEYGGLLTYRDLRDRASHRIEARMKYWWPQTEAMYATLAAYIATKDLRWWRWFERVTDYTLQAFPDPQGPEWFGYLFPDGTVANPIKGSLWKGPFHIPRTLAKCAAALREN